MKLIKIPVENQVGFCVGDIYVDINISFRPMSVPTHLEKVAINKLDTVLGKLSFGIKKDIKKRIENELSPE